MFNVRVYGIFINEHRQILVSDEVIKGKHYTKFCGGGLEIGEGTRDCLKREFLEEMNISIEVGAHLYTTDFYQQSAFNKEHQIISIYYYVTPLNPINTLVSKFPDFETLSGREKLNGDGESFRYIEWDDFSSDSVTLPIDKIVADLLKEKH
jgi:ADP-ribose pyrophosphatase YjhB (NUDIX family)